MIDMDAITRECWEQRSLTPYDWAWRKNGSIMTFQRLFREGLEICPSELYLKFKGAEILLKESYGWGYIRRKELFYLQRIAKIAFVKEYIRCCRMGYSPRVIGPPLGSFEYFNTIYALCESIGRRTSEEEYAKRWFNV